MSFQSFNYPEHNLYYSSLQIVIMIYIRNNKLLDKTAVTASKNPLKMQLHNLPPLENNTEPQPIPNTSWIVPKPANAFEVLEGGFLITSS